MPLGKFLANRDFPCSRKNFRDCLQRLCQAMWCLVKHGRICRSFQVFQDSCPLFLIHWKKSFEGKPACRQTAQRKRRDNSRSPRQRSHRNPGFVGSKCQFGSRIRDRGRTGIGHDSDIFSCQQFIDKNSCLLKFIVFMITGKWRLDIKMIEKFNCLSGILGRDQIYFFQRTQHA